MISFFLCLLFLSLLFSSWFASCLIADEDLCVDFMISQILIFFYIYIFMCVYIKHMLYTTLYAMYVYKYIFFTFHFSK